MKQKIMEALLDPNHNLTKEEIMWAASHLPNTDEKGEHSSGLEHSFTYNHSEKSLYKALGISEDDGEKTADLLSKITKRCAIEDEYTISRAVEETLEKSKDIRGFIPLLLTTVYRSALEKLERQFVSEKLPKELRDLIKGLKKRDEDEDDE